MAYGRRDYAPVWLRDDSVEARISEQQNLFLPSSRPPCELLFSSARMTVTVARVSRDQRTQ